jgi:hypothetical protein
MRGRTVTGDFKIKSDIVNNHAQRVPLNFGKVYAGGLPSLMHLASVLIVDGWCFNYVAMFVCAESATTL